MTISAFEVARRHPIERAAYKTKLYEAEAKLGEVGFLFFKQLENYNIF